MERAEDENGELFAHVDLPVANGEAALATATAPEPYRPDRATTLHVVEKGEGVPDGTPVKQSREVAARSYAAVRTVVPDAGDRTSYARDVGAISEATDEVGAGTIAHCSRGGNRLVQFLSGDRSLRLVAEADRPVVALTRGDANG